MNMRKNGNKLLSRTKLYAVGFIFHIIYMFQILLRSRNNKLVIKYVRARRQNTRDYSRKSCIRTLKLNFRSFAIYVVFFFLILSLSFHGISQQENVRGVSTLFTKDSKEYYNAAAFWRDIDLNSWELRKTPIWRVILFWKLWINRLDKKDTISKFHHCHIICQMESKNNGHWMSDRAFTSLQHSVI